MANYSKGKIAIPNVTGNIVINIEAVQSAAINQIRNAINADGTPYNGGLGYSNLGRRIKSNFTETGGTAYEWCTGFIPLENGKQIYVNHINEVYVSGKSSAGVFVDIYDSSFSGLSRFISSADFAPYSDDTRSLFLGELPAGASYLRLTSFENNGLTRDMATITFE